METICICEPNSLMSAINVIIYADLSGWRRKAPTFNIARSNVVIYLIAVVHPIWSGGSDGQNSVIYLVVYGVHLWIPYESIGIPNDSCG